MDEPRELEKIPVRWLTAEEAARYCCMSSTTFDQHARRIPVARTSTGARAKRVYDIQELDRFMKALETPAAEPIELPTDTMQTARRLLQCR